MLHSAANPETASPSLITGNLFDKYRSRNPIHRWMLSGFLQAANDLIGKVESQTVLEVGCGAGDLGARLFGGESEFHRRGGSYMGIDIGQREIEDARKRFPELQFAPASVYSLPFEDAAFDLVVACEVFEHFDNPDRALDEVARVCRRHLLISVPWEPVWCVLNVARGKYVGNLGNTPGHVQHFSRRGLRQLVSRRFEILDERRPLPWTMLLASVGQAEGRL